jgi:jumonji domain-containing protein 7
MAVAARNNAVFYYSRQNDCLRNELKPLFDKGMVAPTLDFAEEAFGSGPPDAVNLWVGEERAVSAWHKDHYENLFYVASGEKLFHLLPPAFCPFMNGRQLESGRFQFQGTTTNGSDADSKIGWTVVPDTNDDDGGPELVTWLDANLLNRKDGEGDEDDDASDRRNPLLSSVKDKILKVHVHEGDLLYLPALWFHCVTQTCETVGINYWYDMHFDSPAWCYFNFLQQLQSD